MLLGAAEVGDPCSRPAPPWPTLLVARESADSNERIADPTFPTSRFLIPILVGVLLAAVVDAGLSEFLLTLLGERWQPNWTVLGLSAAVTVLTVAATARLMMPVMAGLTLLDAIRSGRGTVGATVAGMSPAYGRWHELGREVDGATTEHGATSTVVVCRFTSAGSALAPTVLPVVASIPIVTSLTKPRTQGWSVWIAIAWFDPVGRGLFCAA